MIRRWYLRTYVRTLTWPPCNVICLLFFLFFPLLSLSMHGSQHPSSRIHEDSHMSQNVQLLAWVRTCVSTYVLVRSTCDVCFTGIEFCRRIWLTIICGAVQTFATAQLRRLYIVQEQPFYSSSLRYTGNENVIDTYPYYISKKKTRINPII